MVVKILRGPLSDNAGVVEQGLRAVGNLADNMDIADAGACDGK